MDMAQSVGKAAWLRSGSVVAKPGLLFLALFEVTRCKLCYPVCEGGNDTCLPPTMRALGHRIISVQLTTVSRREKLRLPGQCTCPRLNVLALGRGRMSRRGRAAKHRALGPCSFQIPSEAPQHPRVEGRGSWRWGFNPLPARAAGVTVTLPYRHCHIFQA